MTKLLFLSDNVLLPEGIQPAAISVDVSSGKIIAIQPRSGINVDINDAEIIDVGSAYLLPGLVDAHVHLNEPGRTDWEGFWTGTRAAASGGVTTVVDMPLNSIPPTTTVSNLSAKRKAAEKQCFIDVAFWGGVIPGNHSHLLPLVSAGVKGFKCFLIESGVEEFPCVQKEDLHAAMSELVHAPSTVLMFHAEIDALSASVSKEELSPTHYSTFLKSRPQRFETDAISLITELQTAYPDLRCHIVHLSAAEAIPQIRAAKKAGLKLTVETCFHYLCLSSEDIPHGHPEFKCCPPIREDSNRDQLWDALKEGLIDFVVSDHSPCVAELKHLDTGNIMDAWGGISTLGLGLSLLWTEASKRGVTIDQILQWTSRKTAIHAGLEARKGLLQVGMDADIVVWDSNKEFKVTKEQLNFKNKLSPYVGMKLRGQVERTYVRGQLVYNGSFVDTPVGQLL